MKDRSCAIQLHLFLLLIIGLVLFALANFATAVLLGVIYTPLAKSHGIYLPLYIQVFIPASIIIVMYPVVGVPIVKSRFRQPLSRRAIILQAVSGLFILPPLSVLTEIGIIFLAKLASPLSAVPIIGEVVKLGTLIPSILFGIIMVTTSLAMVLGIWSSLFLYWCVQKIRSQHAGTTM